MNDSGKYIPPPPPAKQREPSSEAVAKTTNIPARTTLATRGLKDAQTADATAAQQFPGSPEILASATRQELPLRPPAASAVRTEPSGSADVAAMAKFLADYEAQRKSAGIAFVLCLGLGVLGAHRFYMGKPGAVGMLLLTLLSCPAIILLGIGLLGIGAAVIWMLIDLASVTKWVRDHNRSLLDRLAPAVSPPHALLQCGR